MFKLLCSTRHMDLITNNSFSSTALFAKKNTTGVFREWMVILFLFTSQHVFSTLFWMGEKEEITEHCQKQLRVKICSWAVDIYKVIIMYLVLAKTYAISFVLVHLHIYSLDIFIKKKNRILPCFPVDSLFQASI